MRHEPRLTRSLGYREVQVLRYVEATIATEGRSPSYRMIDDKLDLHGKGNVANIVKRLERKGLLSRAGCGRVRRIRLPA